MRYFIGLLFIGIGFGLIFRTQWIVHTFGHIPGIDRWFGGGGGTYALYKFIGLLSIFLSLLYMTGRLQLLIIKFLGPLFGAGK